MTLCFWLLGLFVCLGFFFFCYSPTSTPIFKFWGKIGLLSLRTETKQPKVTLMHEYLHLSTVWKSSENIALLNDTFTVQQQDCDLTWPDDPATATIRLFGFWRRQTCLKCMPTWEQESPGTPPRQSTLRFQYPRSAPFSQGNRPSSQQGCQVIITQKNNLPPTFRVRRVPIQVES